ncbi:MAG: hypothetical protein AB8H86_14795 [Polyangiales bacterium]
MSKWLSIALLVTAGCTAEALPVSPGPVEEGKADDFGGICVECVGSGGEGCPIVDTREGHSEDGAFPIGTVRRVNNHDGVYWFNQDEYAYQGRWNTVACDDNPWAADELCLECVGYGEEGCPLHDTDGNVIDEVARGQVYFLSESNGVYWTDSGSFSYRGRWRTPISYNTCTSPPAAAPTWDETRDQYIDAIPETADYFRAPSEAPTPREAALIARLEPSVEDLAIALERVGYEYTTEGLVCDVLSGGTQVATGITVTLGMTTAACAAAGGTATLATLGAAGAVAVPVCGFVGAGTLAAGATTLLLGSLDALICRGVGSAIIEMVVQAGEAVIDWGRGVVELVIDGVAVATSPCGAAHYAYMRTQKWWYCKNGRRSCDGFNHSRHCPEIAERISRAHYCLAARRAIQLCWGPWADDTHPDEAREALEVLVECQTAAALYCF